MKISIFGLGYVGSVTGACLAQSGHHVIGVDIDRHKLRLLRLGRSPVVEPGLTEMVEGALRKGRFEVTLDATAAIRETDLSIVCVATPSNDNGSIDLEALKRVCRAIGEGIRKKGLYHVVVVRSTVLPGTTRDVVLPTLEKHSRARSGRDFGVCVNPEFLREGSSVKDFFDPPLIVVGAEGERSRSLLGSIYDGLELAAPRFETSLEVAEFVKYACNLFHATKITFANEMGNLAKRLDLDSHEVMSIFCADTKLNCSSTYLRPGFAWGGSCLPKDIRAIAYCAKHLDLELPLVNSLLPSNEAQVRLAYEMVRATEKKKIGLMGLSFKPQTDDLRESPAVALAELLMGKGYRVRIHDEEVALSRLIGANRRYIRHVLPHISHLLERDRARFVKNSEVIVVAKRSPANEVLLGGLPPGKVVIDLVRIADHPPQNGCKYEGICW